VDAILETLLPGKARIVFANLDVWDAGIGLFILADLQDVERVEVGIRSQLFAFEEGWFLPNGDKIFLFTFVINFSILYRPSQRLGLLADRWDEIRSF